MNLPPPPHGSHQEDQNKPFRQEIQAFQTRQRQGHQVNTSETQNTNMRIRHPAAALAEYSRKPIDRLERLSACTTNQSQPLPPYQNTTGHERPKVAQRMLDEIPHSTSTMHPQEQTNMFRDVHSSSQRTEYLPFLATDQIRPLIMHSSQNQGLATSQHNLLMDQAQMAMPPQLDCAILPIVTQLHNVFQENVSGNLGSVAKRPANYGQSDNAQPAEKRPKAQGAIQRLDVHELSAEQPEGHGLPEFIIIDDSDVTPDQSPHSSPTMTPISPPEDVPMVSTTGRFLPGVQESPILISPEPIEIVESPFGVPQAPNTTTPSPFSLERPPIVSPESVTLNQLRRNNKRLMTRYECLQREIDIIDGNMRVAQTELNFADIILNDLLNSEDLPPPIFDRIFQASERLMCAKSGLR